MQDAKERFSGRVENYVRFRERYEPEVMLPRLQRWCGLLPEWVVADIGAGTGMLADVFLANGNRVVAVEPNEEMRSACIELHRDEQRLAVQDGSAETTGLEDASVDVVSVGRALHWFDFDAAMREFRRVLRPGGWVVIVASGRAEDGREENVALTELISRFASNPAAIRAGYALYKRLPEEFSDGAYHHEVIGGETQMSWEEFRGYLLSISYAPLEGSASFGDFSAAMEEMFARFACYGRMTFATRHWITAGRWQRGTSVA